MNFQHVLDRERASIPDVPILIYLLTLGGGAGKNAVKYANQLSERGYPVKFLCGNAPSKKLVEALSPELELVTPQVTRSLRMVPHLFNVIRKFKPALIVVLGASNFLPISIARAATGNESLVLLREANSPSGLLQSYGVLKKILKRWTFSSAFRRADHVIALTQSMRRELEQVWHVPAPQISVIYNGVKIPEQSGPKAASSAIPIILCVARLTPQKDIPTLLRAFAIVIAKYPCRLLMAGSGHEYSRMIDLSSKLGITSYVEFLGHVDDVEPLYSKAAVTVLSSRFEGFPNVLVEALAQACPVVATDCPTGPSEIITSADVGLLAEVGNADDLAAKLLAALNTVYDPRLLLDRAACFSEVDMSTALDAVVTRLLNKSRSSEEHQESPWRCH